MAGTTFRTRLATRLAALCLGVLTMAGALIYLEIRHTLHEGLDQTLLAIARTEVASAFDEPGVGVHVHPESPSALALAGGSGYEKFARISDRAGTVLATTPNLASGSALPDDDAARARALGGTIAFADLTRDGGTYRALYYPVAHPDAPLVALVALPTVPVDRALRAVAGGLALALVIAALGAGFVSAHLAHHLTAPLAAIADAARAVPAQGFAARIPTVSTDEELRTVTEVLNDMLDALERAAFAEQRTAAAQRRFVSDAAHELRSPLTNLRGTIEVTLRRPRTDEEYRETLTAASREIDRLCRLADDLLTLSRAAAGRLSHRPAPCDAAAIVADAVAACAGRAAARDVRVECAENTCTQVTVLADADRLRQVLDNLLDNGLRHAPAGSTVSVAVTGENGTARISVADRGPGLTPEQQAHVFERFYRVDDARARSSGGSGLGLAIAKAIVDAHHGTLAVRSTPGAGATFEVTLPRVTRDPR